MKKEIGTLQIIGYHKFIKLSEVSESSCRRILQKGKKEVQDELNLSDVGMGEVTVPIYEESSCGEVSNRSYPFLPTIRRVGGMDEVLEICSVLEYIKDDSQDEEEARLMLLEISGKGKTKFMQHMVNC